jgi:hypothetical protein
MPLHEAFAAPIKILQALEKIDLRQFKKKRCKLEVYRARKSRSKLVEGTATPE